MVASPDVPVISGSIRTGQAISAVGARKLKRFGLELGGQTHHLLFDDADLDAALQVLVHFDCHVQLQAWIGSEQRRPLADELRPCFCGPSACVPARKCPVGCTDE